MGYYAKGEGFICVQERQLQAAIDTLHNALDNALEAVVDEDTRKAFSRFFNNEANSLRQLEELASTCGIECTYDGSNADMAYFTVDFDGNWHDDEMETFLSIAKYISKGEISIQGEDDSMWRYVFGPQYPNHYVEQRGEVVYDSMTQQKFDSAVQCLKDNGIDDDEAETVCQALCYILMDKETAQYFKN